MRNHLRVPIDRIRDTERSRINFDAWRVSIRRRKSGYLQTPCTLPTSTPVSRKKGKKPLELLRECRPGSEEQGEQCINSGTPSE